MVHEEFAGTDGTQLLVCENGLLVPILMERLTGSLFITVIAHGGLGIPIPNESRKQLLGDAVTSCTAVAARVEVNGHAGAPSQSTSSVPVFGPGSSASACTVMEQCPPFPGRVIPQVV